jgi:hypothetical protein
MRAHQSHPRSTEEEAGTGDAMAVRVLLRADPELDPEGERLTRRLRAELAELDVDSVQLAAGSAAPAGAKGDAVTLGALIVALSASGGGWNWQLRGIDCRRSRSDRRVQAWAVAGIRRVGLVLRSGALGRSPAGASTGLTIWASHCARITRPCDAARPHGGQ